MCVWCDIYIYTFLLSDHSDSNPRKSIWRRALPGNPLNTSTTNVYVISSNRRFVNFGLFGKIPSDGLNTVYTRFTHGWRTTHVDEHSIRQSVSAVRQLPYGPLFARPWRPNDFEISALRTGQKEARQIKGRKMSLYIRLVISDYSPFNICVINCNLQTK